MDVYLGALLIFAMRVTDVSVGTLRMLFTVRGRKYISASLALIESGIFIIALSHVMSDLHSPIKLAAYAFGYAAGNFSGITIERWIGSGTIVARVISRHSVELISKLRSHSFGVTSTKGEGRDGEVYILFVVSPRRRERELLDLIESLDSDAFVTVDSVNAALGGYLTASRRATSVRK